MVRTRFFEFHIGGRLVALAVTDMPADGLSAVYTFFDPELAPRSLGTFAILRQIAHAQALGLPTSISATGSGTAGKWPTR